MAGADQATRAAGDSAQGGIFGAMRGIGPAFIALIKTRIELLGIELAEERSRLGVIAILGAGALLCAGMLLLLANLFVLAWFWDGHRFQAIAGLIVLHGAGLAACALAIKARVDARPPMFEATIAELKADLEAVNHVRPD